MFNKTRFRLQCFIVSSFFFQGKASHIDEKIVCMVEYIQLTTVFFIRSQTKQVTPVLSFSVHCPRHSWPPLLSLLHIRRGKRLPGL